MIDDTLMLLDSIKAYIIVEIFSLSPEPQYALGLFYEHLWAFSALSATNKILFNHLVPTYSIHSKSICGMLCGRKKHFQSKKYKFLFMERSFICIEIKNKALWRCKISTAINQRKKQIQYVLIIINFIVSRRSNK